MYEPIEVVKGLDLPPQRRASAGVLFASDLSANPDKHRGKPSQLAPRQFGFEKLLSLIDEVSRTRGKAAPCGLLQIERGLGHAGKMLGTAFGCSSDAFGFISSSDQKPRFPHVSAWSAQRGTPDLGYVRIAPSHSATPTTDNRQPTTDNRQPTTDNRQPTTDNRHHVGLSQEDAMSVSFDVYRISQYGGRELVRTTQSAREAREVRDAAPGEMLVIVSDDGVMKDNERERAIGGEAQGNLEDDHLL